MMDGQISDLMAEIGTKARAAAAELAFAESERKYAALIGASHEIWNRRQDILDANCEDLVYAEEKGLSCRNDRPADAGRGAYSGHGRRPARPWPSRPIRWAGFWPNGTARMVCIFSGLPHLWAWWASSMKAGRM